MVVWLFAGAVADGPSKIDASSREWRLEADGLTLCVINYNGEGYLEETLTAVRVQRQHFAEIILVDDASSDGSLPLVRERFPEVRIVALSENRGPAAARNAGFEAASHELILFADNDVVLGDSCADELVRALRENPRAVAAMPRVLYAAEPDTVQYDGAHAHYLGLMVLEGVDTPTLLAARETRPIGSVITACFLLHRGRWGEESPFDESFFIYYEDFDFGLRCRLAGHEVLSVPAARCLHREGTPGLSLRESGGYARRRIHSHIRNRWQVVAKSYGARTLLLLAPPLATYEAFQLAGVMKKGWLGEWLRAAGWMLRNGREVLRDRAAVQRGRRVPDRGLLHGGPLPFHEALLRSRLERMGKRALDALFAGYWQLVEKWI